MTLLAFLFLAALLSLAVAASLDANDRDDEMKAQR